MIDPPADDADEPEDDLPADPPDPAGRTPEIYLADGFTGPDGHVRPELVGYDSFAAASQFFAAEVPAQELAATHEALRQEIAPLASPKVAHLEDAVDEALDIVERMLGIENSEAIETWLITCAAYIRNDADLDAFLAHFQAVVRQYSALTAITPGAAPVA
jgi:hypothetical protein